jgi:hypothetical protein
MSSLLRISAIAILCALSPLHAYAEEATTTPELPPEVPVETVTISIRDGATLVGPFTVDLPAADAPAVSLSATGSDTLHEIPARSVLALLSALDATSEEIEITDLAYFDSFNSFIVNCVSVPEANDSPDCYSWTYAVDGTFPFFGMDAYPLLDGDVVHIIFGSQWRISTDKPSATTTESVGITVEEYDPETGEYEPKEGERAGAVQFDSNFMATEFATSTTDSEGHATLIVPVAGEYSVGIASTGYFPNVPLTVTESSPEDPGEGSGNGGGGGVHHDTFSVHDAVSYLTDTQEDNGSFGTSFLSDWAALAFVAADHASQDSLRDYLASTPMTFSSVTDYERHAMALLALGINPYEGTDVITPIVQAFDGTQIGNPHEDNDDIFALFPLLHAGYSEDDVLIQKTVAFILLTQEEDGSWNSSVDMTAAAIQALALVDDLPGVEEALAQGEEYLRSTQEDDGGWDNSFATSWVLQAIAALGDSPEEWEKNSSTPIDFLTNAQEEDGGVEDTGSSVEMRVWATSYAIPGALGKTWDSLLSSVLKPELETSSTAGTSGLVLGVTASSTPSVSTTTPSTSTSTAPVLVKEPVQPVLKAANTSSLTLPVLDEGVIEAPHTVQPQTSSLWVNLWGAVMSFVTFLANLL